MPLGAVRRFVPLFVLTGRGLLRPPFGWPLGLAGVFALALAYVWKRPIDAVFHGCGVGFTRKLADAINLLGGGLAVVVAVLLLLLLGQWFRRQALVEAALVLAAAGIWCWILTMAGQALLAERRPFEGGELDWFRIDGHGVSGHAAGAALVFFPFRNVLLRRSSRGVRTVVSIAALFVALVVGWSRMCLGMHFLWNVAAGFAIGLYTGYSGWAAWRGTARVDSA